MSAGCVGLSKMRQIRNGMTRLVAKIAFNRVLWPALVCNWQKRLQIVSNNKYQERKQ